MCTHGLSPDLRLPIKHVFCVCLFLVLPFLSGGTAEIRQIQLKLCMYRANLVLNLRCYCFAFPLSLSRLCAVPSRFKFQVAAHKHNAVYTHSFYCIFTHFILFSKSLHRFFSSSLELQHGGSTVLCSAHGVCPVDTYIYN